MNSIEAATLALVEGVRAKLMAGVLPPAGYSTRIASSEPTITADGITWLRSGVLSPAAQFPKVPVEFQLLGASSRVAASNLSPVGVQITAAAAVGNIGVYVTSNSYVYYTTDGGETFTQLAGRNATSVFECNGYFYFSGATSQPWRTADFVTIENVTIPSLSTSQLAGIAFVGGSYRAFSNVATVTDYISDDGITFTQQAGPTSASPTALVSNGRMIIRITSATAVGPHISTGKGSWELSKFMPQEATTFTMQGAVRVGDYIMIVTSVGNYASIDGEQWEFWGSLPTTPDITFRPMGMTNKGLVVAKLGNTGGIALSNNGRGWYQIPGIATTKVPMIVGKYLIIFEQSSAGTTALRYEPTKMVGHPFFTDNTYYRVA